MQSPVPFAVLDDPMATWEAYARHIEQTGLADASIRSYSLQVKMFMTWLSTQPGHQPGEAFTDPHSRDWAVRDYRSHLLNERGLAPASVDVALASLDSLYLWLGIGRSTVKRVHAGAPASGFDKHLDKDQSKAVMRAAEKRGPRDEAIVGLMLMGGLRAGEVVKVNTADWGAGARSGGMTIRGKGSQTRRLIFSAQLRALMLKCEVDRRRWETADPGFFVTSKGTRIANRTVNYLVSRVGEAAGVPALFPHQLRHTFARNLLDQGVPVTDIQEALGHASLNTTMIYLKANTEQMQNAADKGMVDY
jgi:integrase/recombinase XerC